MKNNLVRTLFHSTAALAAVGLACLIGGGVALSAARDIHRAYATGNWSVDRVRDYLDIRTHDDLDTPREATLFKALARTNRECQARADAPAEAGRVLMIVGVSLVAISVLQYVTLRKLQKETPDQPGEINP